MVSRLPYVRVLVAYLVVQAAVVAAFLSTTAPRDRGMVNVIGDVITVGFAVAGVLVVGKDRVITWLIVATLALLGLGDLVALRMTSPTGDIPFPGPPDVPYSIGTVVLLVVFVMVAHRTGSGPNGAWLDTALASTGLVVLALQIGIVTALDAGNWLAVAVSLLYAAVDVVGCVVGAWCVVSSRGLTLGAGLLAAACAAWYLSDLTYAVEQAKGSYLAGGALDLGWYVPNAILAWTCWTGFGPLSSSTGRERTRSRRLLLAGVIGLCGPIGLIGTAAVGIPVSAAALATVMAVPVLLALLRMHGLMRAMEHQATHDGLTGLLNRTEFTVQAAHSLADRSAGAVLVIDLNDFKQVNDRSGHSAGDAVLLELARRLSSWAPPGTILGRIGGDEFAAVIPRSARRRALAEAAELAAVIEVTVRADGSDLDGAPDLADGGHVQAVTASIGTAVIPPGVLPPSLDDVLAEADAQMYRAKQAARREAARAKAVAARGRVPGYPRKEPVPDYPLELPEEPVPAFSALTSSLTSGLATGLPSGMT